MEVKSAKFLGGSIVVSTILYCVCLLFTTSNTKETVARFQLVSDGTHAYVIDSQTGMVWPDFSIPKDTAAQIFTESKMDVVE